MDTLARPEVMGWMQNVLGDILDVAPDTVDVNMPFARFGIDSATALIVTDMLSEWLGRDLDPTLLYDHDTIASLAEHLAAEAVEGGGS